MGTGKEEKRLPQAGEFCLGPDERKTSMLFAFFSLDDETVRRILSAIAIFFGTTVVSFIFGRWWGKHQAKKQWQKAATALQDPEDRLIVEGYPTLDPRFPGITVLATNVTTRNLQIAQRAAQPG